MTDTNPIPQLVEIGETMHFSVAVPDLPDAFTRDAESPGWVFVLTNLETRTETSFAGELIGPSNMLTWTFSTANLEPGPYTWRIQYTATEKQATQETTTRVMEATVGDDNFLDTANTFYEPYPSSIQSGTVIDPNEVDKIYIEIQRPGLPGQRVSRITVNPPALIALTSSAPGSEPQMVGQVTGLKVTDALGSAWTIGIDAANRPLFSADPAATNGIYLLMDYAETIPLVNLRRTTSRGYLTVSDPSAKALHEAVMIPIIEQAMEDRLKNTGDISAYTIGGRSISTMPIEELRRLRARYKETVATIKRKGKMARLFGYSETYGRNRNWV